MLLVTWRLETSFFIHWASLLFWRWTVEILNCLISRQFFYSIFSRLLPKYSHTNLISWDFYPNLAICPFQQSPKKLVLCLLARARQNLWDSHSASPGYKLGSNYTQFISLNWTNIAFRVCLEMCLSAMTNINEHFSADRSIYWRPELVRVMQGWCDRHDS